MQAPKYNLEEFNKTKRFEKRIDNYRKIINVVTPFSSITLWLSFSFVVSGLMVLKFRTLQLFSASLETIALIAITPALFSIIVFPLYLLNRKKKYETLESLGRIEQNNNLLLKRAFEDIRGESTSPQTKKAINSYTRGLNNKLIITSLKQIEQLEKNKQEIQELSDRVKNETTLKKIFRIVPTYANMFAISILTINQTIVVIDLWVQLGINSSLYKKLGLIFDFQTIFDTIGLGILVISSITRVVYNLSEKDTERRKEKTIEQKVKETAFIILPIFGAFLSLIGKIGLGISGCGIWKIPTKEGGFVPWSLILRGTGMFIVIAVTLAEVIGALNKPIEDDISVSTALNITTTNEMTAGIVATN